jgi:large subunit ribosomal protein L13
MRTETFKEPKVRKWVLVDLTDQPLGRVATRIADILRGRHRATFTPNVDTGDFVVAINAGKVKLTGKKLHDKMYYWHSRFIGGLRERNAEKLMAKHPEQVVERAVKGMLPHNDLSRKVIKKLKIFAGGTHPYQKQLAS